MSDSLYFYRNKLQPMDEEKFINVMEKSEVKYRTNTINYKPLGLSKKQFDEIKKSWDKDLLVYMSELSKKETPMNSQVAFKVLKKTIDEKIDVVGDNSGRIKTSELSLCMMLDTIPLFNPNGIVSYNNSKFSLRITNGLEMIAVPVNDVNESDYFISVFYDNNFKKSWLLGWATRQDMTRCSKGSRITNPDVCRWSQFSYYKPVLSLRPMIDLVRELGIKELPSGILFETIPDNIDLAIAKHIDIDSLIMNNSTEENEKAINEMLAEFDT